jgi:chromosome segregation ATPase
MQAFDEPESEYYGRGPKWPLYTIVAILLVATVLSSAYLYRERQQARELAATNQTLSASLVQMQNQLMTLNQRIQQAEEAAPARLPEAVATRPRPAKARPAAASKAAKPRASQDDPRFKELQGQLSEQQKQLASTREDLSKTRDDLSGAISSTRSELSGSIATTHEEVVALQKRGERNYYEFELNKSKQFQRVGPLRLSLRKADSKHKRFDMNLMVDDNELQKKSVNLYETIWINAGDRPQPMELVVNQVTKDHIQGYLSESKYKKSELSQAAASSDPKPIGLTQR